MAKIPTLLPAMEHYEAPKPSEPAVMSEISAMADWLRQRDGEADAVWIERLRAVFEHDGEWADDPKADRLGERLWKRLQAKRSKAAEPGI